MTSNTLLPIPIEFGTVFELGVQRLETSEQIQTQYSHPLAKLERQRISRNRLLEAVRIKETRIAFCLTVFSGFFKTVICSIETYIVPQV